MGRNKKVMKETTTIEAAFGVAKDEIQALSDEMGEWRDNLQGTGLENTGKFETIQETAYALEMVRDNLEYHDLPEVLNGWPVEYTYLRPYGRKPMSRYDRSSMALNALYAVASILSLIRDAWDEKKKPGAASEDVAILEADQLRGLNEEQMEELLERAKEVEDACEEACSELENVEFPGFY